MGLPIGLGIVGLECGLADWECGLPIAIANRQSSIVNLARQSLNPIHNRQSALSNLREREGA